MDHPHRWVLRFSNFRKALAKLSEAVAFAARSDVPSGRVSGEILKEGIIQRFEYTHELAWNVMKDYAEFQGNASVGGSRDATREAFRLNLVEDGSLWMEMIASRNRSTHTYHQDTADEIYSKIVSAYHPAFLAFEARMEALRSVSDG